jgi:hypothetical protein
MNNQGSEIRLQMTQVLEIERMRRGYQRSLRPTVGGWRLASVPAGFSRSTALLLNLILGLTLAVAQFLPRRPWA